MCGDESTVNNKMGMGKITYLAIKFAEQSKVLIFLKWMSLREMN